MLCVGYPTLRNQLTPELEASQHAVDIDNAAIDHAFARSHLEEGRPSVGAINDPVARRSANRRDIGDIPVGITGKNGVEPPPS